MADQVLARWQVTLPERITFREITEGGSGVKIVIFLSGAGHPVDTAS